MKKTRLPAAPQAGDLISLSLEWTATYVDGQWERTPGALVAFCGTAVSEDGGLTWRNPTADEVQRFAKRGRKKRR